MSSPENTPISFDNFQFDPQSLVLRHEGEIQHLQPKPSRVLALLLKEPGALVTREELQEKVWEGEVVEFDQSLNFCIKCIRGVLNDSARNPNYIQTVPRRGYRFIGTVSEPSPDNKETSSGHHSSDFLTSGTVLWPEERPHQTFQAPSSGKGSPIRGRVPILVGALLLVFLLVGGFAVSWERDDKPETITSGPKEPSLSAVDPSEQLLQRGIYLFERGSQEDLRRAATLFEQAAVASPDRAAPFAHLAIARLYLAGNDMQLAQARELADKALMLNPGNAQAHLAKAMFYMYVDWDMPLSRFHLEKATALDASLTLAWHELAVVSAVMGDFETAARCIEHGLALEPGKVQEQYHAAWFYLIDGRTEDALDQARQSLEIDPNHLYSLLCAADASLTLGLMDVASGFCRRYMELVGAEQAAIQQVENRLKQGDKQAFFEWYAKSPGVQANPFSSALAQARLGNKEAALKELSKAVERKNPMVPTAWAFSEFADFREDPGFVAVMAPVKRFPD